MKKSQTILGTKIPLNTRGIVYFGTFNRESLELIITEEKFFDTPFKALNCYANTYNPPSQLVSGGTYDELISNLSKLHNRMKNKKWLESLADCL
jgi:hypothetical protein